MAVSSPTDVGKNTPVAASTAATVTFTTTAVIPSGGKLLLAVGWFSATATLSSVSATGGTGQVLKQQTSVSNHFGLASIDFASGLASGSTVTATFSDSTADSRYICGSYVTGAATAGEYGAVGQSQTAALWSATATTVTSGDLLYGGSYTATTNGTSTPSGGNTELHDFAIAGDSAMTDVYQLSSGSLTAQGTWTVNQTCDSAAVVIAALAAGVLRPFNPIPFLK